MLFLGKNNTEKRLTQTQIKCLLQLMGGKVATVRNERGNIIVVGTAKVGNRETIEVLEELGAAEYRNSIRGWCLTEYGNKAARRFTYFADINITPSPGNNGFDVLIDNKNYAAFLAGNHLYATHQGTKKTLFEITPSDPHWIAFKSKCDKNSDLLLVGLHERIISAILNSDWAKRE